MLTATNAGVRLAIPMRQLAKIPMSETPISGFAGSIRRPKAAARRDTRSGFIRILAIAARYELALTFSAMAGLNE